MRSKQKSTGPLPFWLVSASDTVLWLQEHSSSFSLLATFLKASSRGQNWQTTFLDTVVLFCLQDIRGGTVSRETNEEKCESELFSESLSEGQSRTWCSLQPCIPVTWSQAVSSTSKHPVLLKTPRGCSLFVWLFKRHHWLQVCNWGDECVESETAAVNTAVETHSTSCPSLPTVHFSLSRRTPFIRQVYSASLDPY